MIESVFIQTMTGCTANCKICPHSKTYKKFGKQVMSEKTLKKILSDLGENYTGSVDFYLHYEPLLDKRIFDFIELTKQMCPKAEIAISTNASLLDKDNAIKLITSQVRVFIHFNETDKKRYEKEMGLDFDTVVKNINRYFDMGGTATINYVKTKQNQAGAGRLKEMFPDARINDAFWASNRAGGVEVDIEGPTKFGGTCVETQIHANIVATGDVIMCCNDWNREHIFGNVNTENLYDIFEKTKQTKLCKRCS